MYEKKLLIAFVITQTRRHRIVFRAKNLTITICRSKSSYRIARHATGLSKTAENLWRKIFFEHFFFEFSVRIQQTFCANNYSGRVPFFFFS